MAIIWGKAVGYTATRYFLKLKLSDREIYLINFRKLNKLENEDES